MLLLIDNYDSFTWNLYHYLGEEITSRGARAPEIKVVRNDEITVAEAKALNPQAVVLSPGPCDPDRAGVCLPLIAAMAAETPILGVCLGHQALGQAFGGRVVRAEAIMHGKISRIRHRGLSVFRDVPDGFEATRYHSLTVARDDLPDALEITAESEDGTIMGLRHRQHPCHGVQFHPESIATEHGRAMVRNFLEIAEVV
ncbi:MAG: aminodeoxychorismate/anthranilate synthase component II [Pseudomonadota bacterium]